MSETRQEFLSGKCRYCHIHAPDRFGHWSVNLFLDDKSKVLWKQLQTEGILNRLRTDKNGEGDFVTLRCPVEKKIRGTMTKMQPVTVIKDGLPYVGMIGDGSDITCMITVYKYRKPITNEGGTAIRLGAIKVLNLIEANLKAFPKEGQEKAEALIGNSDPIW